MANVHSCYFISCFSYLKYMKVRFCKILLMKSKNLSADLWEMERRIFLRNMAEFSIRDSDMDRSLKKNKFGSRPLSKVSDECSKLYATLTGMEKVMGCYQNGKGTIYCSVAHANSNGKISNCLVSTKENQFQRINVFLEVEHKILAVLEPFRSYQFLSKTDSDLDSRT